MMTGDLNHSGADELFRYQPSTGRVIVEQFSAEKTPGMSATTAADPSGDGIDEVFRYELGVGHVSIFRQERLMRRGKSSRIKRKR